MSDEGYNGWKNYPTWAVHLWLNNDQSSQEWALEIARENLGKVVPRWVIGDVLKEAVREMVDGEMEKAGMSSDLLGYALDCVDWYEIADAYLEMAQEQDEDEQEQERRRIERTFAP